MKTLAQLKDCISNVLLDSDREENWKGLESFVEGKDEVEDAEAFRKELAKTGSHFERTEWWEHAARIWELLAALEGDGPAKADLVLRAGKAYDDELFDGKRARAAFEEALRLRPGDAAASAGLDRLKALTSGWQEAVKRYLDEAQATENTQYRSQLYLQAAALHQKFGGKAKDKIKDILHYLQGALELDSSNRQAVRFLRRILAAKGQWEEVAALHERLAQVARTRDEKIECLGKFGAVLALRLGRAEDAAKAYEQILEIVPNHREAIAFLVTRYTEKSDTDKLIAVYENFLKTHPPKEDEIATLLQIAIVHWRVKGDMDKAEEYFRRIRRVIPDHPAAAGFYRGYFRQKGEWLKLVQLLSESVRAARTPDESVALWSEIAEISEQNLGNMDRAIDAYKAILKVRPDDRATLSLLKEKYRRAEKWNALLDVLKSQLAAARDDAAAKTSLLKEIAVIYRDNLALDVMVLKTYNQILELDPRDPEAWTALTAIYEKGEKWADLAALYEKRLAVERDPAQQAAFLAKIADITINRQANFVKATPPLERILQLQPDNREVMGTLKGIYIQRRMWEPLFGLLEKELPLLPAGERVDCMVQMADLAWEKLGKVPEAVALLWKVLDERPGAAEVLRSLEKLCERGKDWEGLARSLGLQSAAEESADGKAALLVKLGSVVTEKLGKPQDAERAWGELLKIKPGHPKAMGALKEFYTKGGQWEKLRKLYAEAGNWEGLAEVFMTTSDQLEKTGEKIRLLLEAAQIYTIQVGAPPKAVKAYEKVLLLAPENRIAGEALLPIHEKDGNFKRVIEIHQKLLATAASKEEKLERLRKLVVLLGEKAGRTEDAFAMALSAHELAPDEPEVEAAVDAYGEKTAAWEKLIGIYRARAASGPKARRADFRKKLAATLWRRAGKVEEALEVYREILAAGPADEEAGAAVEEILRATGRLDELVQLFEERLARAAGKREKAALLRAMASIAHEGLDDSARAIDCYARLLEIEHDDAEAIGQLESLYRATGRWADLVDVLDRKRLFIGEAGNTDIAAEIATIEVVHLARYAKALEELAAVLATPPAGERAVDLLEKLLKLDEHKVAAARLVRPHLAPLGRHAQEAWVLQILIEAARDPDERRALYEALAIVEDEKLADPAAAFATIARAVEEFPAVEPLWDRLEQLAAKTGAWEETAARFDALMAGGEAGEAGRLGLARRLAAVCSGRLGDMDRAETHHRWIFERMKDDAPSFDALEAIYSGADRFEDLKALYRAKAEAVADAAERLELLRKIAFINEEMQDNRKAAVEVYREMTAQDRTSETARRSLERLYEQEGMWVDLADLLEENLALAGADPGSAVRFKLAEVIDLRLKEPERALACYRAVLEASPTHLKAQEALERFLGIDEVRQEAARILEPIYERQGAWPPLVTILDVLRAGAPSDGERIDILLKAADIQEKRLKNFDAAFETLAQAFDIDPSREDTAARLENLAGAINYWGIFVDVLEGGIGKVSDRELKGRLLFRVARIHEWRLADAAKAEKAFRRFLDLGGDDREMTVAAARALETIYAEGRRYAELAGVLELQAGAADDPGARRELLKRIAEIQETMLGHGEAAIAVNLRILEIAPDDPGAIASLRRLYRAAGRWEDLAAILKKLVDMSRDPAEKKALHYEIGALWSEKLGNTDEAIFTYQLVNESFGEEAPALRALLGLYEKAGSFPDVVETMDRLIALAPGGDDAVALLLAAGRVEKERLGDLDAAVGRFCRVMELRPGGAEALRELEALLAEEPVRLKVARLLGPHYERAGEYAKLLAMVEIEIAQEGSYAAKVALCRRAADIAENGLTDQARAFALYADALRLRLDDSPQIPPLIDELERITRETGDWKRLVDLYAQLAPDALNEALQLRFSMRIAEIHYRNLGTLDVARDWYTKVLDIAPASVEAKDRLEEIYTRTEDFPRLVEILRMKCDAAQDPARKVELLFRQARIAGERLADEAAAIAAYEAALELEESRDAVMALEKLYAATGRWNSFRDVLERQLEWPGADLATLHFRLGVTLYENLGDPDGALGHLRQAIQVRPDHPQTIGVLEKLLKESAFKEQAADILEPIYLATMKFDRLLDIMEIKLEAAGDPAARRDIFMRMGKIHEEQIEDLEKAFGVYVRMLGEDVESKDVQQNIDRLANVLDIWPQAAEAYRKVLDDVISDSPGTADLWYHLGTIQDAYCDDAEGAVGSFRRALAFDPSDRRFFNALEAILKRDDRWAQQLFDLYRASVDTQASPAERKKTLNVMGRLSEEKLGNRQQAIEIWKEVLSEDPKDEAALMALERLYHYEGQFRNLADLLLERIDMARNAVQQIELRHKLAGIYSEHLDDRDAAIELYGQILAQDPSYQDSVVALEGMMDDPGRQMGIVGILVPIYREFGKWQKLIRAHEIELRHLAEPSERKQRFIRMGELYEGMASDWVAAYGAYLAALREDSSDATLLEKVMGLAEKLDAWDRLVKVLDEAARASTAPSEQETLLRWEGRILDRRLGNFRGAVDVYKRLLENAPGDAEALEALDSLSLLLADWEGLLWVLDSKAEAATGAEAMLAIRRRQGQVCEDQLSDAKRAIGFYRAALEIDPADHATMEALETLYELQSEWQDLVGLLAARTGYATDSFEKRALLVKSAAILKEKLDNPGEAIDAYQQVLALFPDDAEVMKVLDDLLAGQRRWEDAYENLGARARITYDEEELVAIMLKMDRVLREELKDTDRAIDNLRRILEIRESEEACRSLEAIARNEDYRLSVVGILEPIYRRAGRFEGLVTLYRLRLEIMLDPAERARALVQMADVQEQGLRDRKASLATLLEALKEEVWIEDVYRKAEILAGELGAYGAFAGVLEEKLGAIYDAAVAADLAMRVGRIWEGKVGDAGRAIEAYRRVLGQGGAAEPEALAALERLYTAAQRWPDLLEVLERRQATLAGERERTRLSLVMAQLRLQKLGDAEGAVAAWAGVLRDAPGEQEAVAGLEGLLDRGELADEIIGALAAAYRATGSPRKLVDLMDLKAKRAPSVEERCEILKEEAALAEEELKDPDTAMRALVRALWELPDDRGLLEELERLCEVLGAWEFLSSQLARILKERSPSDETRRDMSLRVARWARGRLRDHAAGAAWYERYLELDPENVQVMEEHEEELAAVRAWGKLLDAMERREALEYDGDRRRAVLRSIAGIALRETKDAARAGAAYEKLHALDDTDLEVLDALIRLRTDLEEWDAVIALVQRRIECTPDPLAARDLRFTLAGLLTDVRKDDDRAVDVYREILDFEPDDAKAAERLERLYRAGERWDDLKDFYVMRVDRTPSGPGRARLLVELARLLEEKMGDADGAVDYYTMAYDIDPASTEVVAALERLLSAAGRTDDLIDLLRRRSEVVRTADEEAYLAILVRIGEIYYRSQGSPQLAVDYYERVLERDNENVAALSALSVIYESREEWAKCISVLDRAAGATKNLEEMGNIFFKIGTIKRDRMGDWEGALEAFNAVLEVCPGHPKILDTLLESFAAKGHWARYVNTFEVKAQKTQDGAARAELLMELAGTVKEKLGDPARARKYLEQAIALRPFDVKVEKALADAYIEGGEVEKAAGIIEKLIKNEESRGVKKSRELAGYLALLGKVLEQRGQLAQAAQRYEEASRMDIGNLAVIFSLGTLCEKTGEIEKAMKALRPLLLQNLDQSGVDKAEVYFLLGRLHGAKGEKSKALNMLDRGLAARPGHEGITKLLAELKK